MKQNVPKKAGCLIICALILTSCMHRKFDIIFNRVEHIMADSIPVQHLPTQPHMAITKDILTVTSDDPDRMLHLYKIPELTYLYGTSGQGRGPNEFSVFPMIAQTVRMDKLYLWGYTPLTIKEWEMNNDSLRLNSTYTLNRYENFNQLHIAQDSLFIYSAIPGDFSIKKYNLHENRETGKIALTMDDHQQPYYSSNYGWMAASDHFIVYAYRYKKQIDIYEITTLKLKKRISGDYDHRPIDLHDYKHNVQQYVNIVAGEKYFYALYRGRSGNDRTINCDAIEVFDYNGNPVVKYTFDVSPLIFTVDESNKMLYGYSHYREDYFLKCRLP